MDLQGEAEFLEPPKPSSLRDPGHWMGSWKAWMASSMMGRELSNSSSEAIEGRQGNPSVQRRFIHQRLRADPLRMRIPPPPMSTDAAHIGLRGLSLGSDDVFKLSTEGLTIGRSSAQLSIESDQFLSETHGRVGADEHDLGLRIWKV